MSRLRSKFSIPPPIPDRSLAGGVRVNDNVVLVKPLGKGAMGSVWVAFHETLRTQVAVKFIGEALPVDDAEVLARFNREASTAAQIKSPYVVQTFDQGVMSSGIPYIVMELLEGESLEERIWRDHWLGLEETEVVIAQTGKALAAAHARGIVHRDIKPENIFLTTVTGDLHVKVFDFGIAKQTDLPQLEGITFAGQTVGTPEFMSPEQLFDSRLVDHRADLWSLAVVAYCCLTGRLPFEAETLPALCKLLLQGKYPPPSEHQPHLTPAIDDWFAKALHADISERFGSAKEMAVSFVRVMAATRFTEEANALEELFITSDVTVPQIVLEQPSSASSPESSVARPRADGSVAAPSLLVPVGAAGPMQTIQRRRSLMKWGAVSLTMLVLLVALIFGPELGSLFRPKQQEATVADAAAAAPTAAKSTAPAVSGASTTPGQKTEPLAGPAPVAETKPTEIDGKDADAWRTALRGAVLRGDAAIAAGAFLALAEIAPERFGERKVLWDGATAAHMAASTSEATSDPVFALLGGEALGHHAIDILYRITSIHGGSPSAKRATELLQREDVLKRATPALRIALAVRDAGCRDRPALFKRAAADGDKRTLYLLLAMRGAACRQISCCMQQHEGLDSAITRIRERLSETG